MLSNPVDYLSLLAKSLELASFGETPCFRCRKLGRWLASLGMERLPYEQARARALGALIFFTGCACGRAAIL